MKKRASVHLRKNILYFSSSSQTVLSAWIGSPPYIKADFSEKDDNINKIVLDVLNASKQGVPYPKTFNGLFEPVLTLAGVKSYRTFMKGAFCCELEEENGMVTITPTQNEGGNGFSHLNDASIKLCSEEKDNIAQKLRVAFGLCV